MRLTILLITLYFVAFLPAFSQEKSQPNTGRTLTQVEQSIKDKCGDDEECNQQELDVYVELLKNIQQKTRNFHIESIKIEQLLKSFQELTDEQKQGYLYARFVYASIGGCKTEAIKAKKVLPSVIFQCIKDVEPQNKSDSEEMIDKVEFKFKGRSEAF